MSDTPRTEADFANILNEAFGRGSIHAELENSDYLSHHLKADEKMAAYREWRDAKARGLAAVTAERDALREDLMVERAWHRFEVAVDERDDLVILLKRLTGAVARNHPARAAAIEYIRRHGLMSPLRGKEGM